MINDVPERTGVSRGAGAVSDNRRVVFRKKATVYWQLLQISLGVLSWCRQFTSRKIRQVEKKSFIR